MLSIFMAATKPESMQGRNTLFRVFEL